MMIAVSTLTARPLSFVSNAILALMLAASAPALAQSTGVTGQANPAPINRDQPSLALHFALQHQGIYGIGVPIRIFAYSDSYWSILTSQNWVEPDGRAFLRTGNASLFAQLGTTYGAGDGSTTFNIPDLRGRSPMGDGQRPGGSNYTLSQHVGVHELALTTDNIPPHTHTIYAGVPTGSFGSGQPFSNIQPSAVIAIDIATNGIFPMRGNGDEQGSIDPATPFYGQILFHSVRPLPGSATAPANGAIISLFQNTGLFSIMGTYYGGNGTNNFALPDFRGTLATSATPTIQYLPDRSSHLIGERYGAETTTLYPGQLPAHSHTVTGQPDTGLSGSALAVANAQPTLPVSWFIARGGVFPASSYMDDQSGYVGEIIAFAGNYTPAGFAACNGQLLNKNYDSTLFFLIGYTYGGSGDLFAVPDLRSRVPVMATASLPAGTVFGYENIALTASNLPAHSHTLPVVCMADITADSAGTTYNPNGSVGAEDLEAFVNAFIAENANVADVATDSADTTRNPNGSVGPEDLEAFVNAFIAGC